MVNETLSLNSRYEPGTILATAMPASPPSTKGVAQCVSLRLSNEKAGRCIELTRRSGSYRRGAVSGNSVPLCTRLFRAAIVLSASSDSSSTPQSVWSTM